MATFASLLGTTSLGLRCVVRVTRKVQRGVGPDQYGAVTRAADGARVATMMHPTCVYTQHPPRVLRCERNTFSRMERTRSRLNSSVRR